MDKIIEVLRKLEHAEDQVVVGLVRAYGNLKVAKALLEAALAQDLGPDINAFVQELIVVVDKAMAITGPR